MRKVTLVSNRWRCRKVSQIAVVVLLFCCSTPRMAEASFGSWSWVYKTCHGRFADDVGSAAGMLVSLPVAGVCGVVLLPADLVHKIRQPQARFFHHSSAVCSYPSGVVGGAAYLVVGAPFYAVQWLFWDLPHGPCPPPVPPAPRPPETKPATESS